MATVTGASLDEALRRLYASWDVETLLELTSPALAKCCPRGDAKLGGSGFLFPVRSKANWAHGYVAETGDIPDARQTEILQAMVYPSVQAGRVEVSGLARAISSGDEMAFVRAFDEQVTSTMETMELYNEGAFFRDGSGILTRFNGAVATSAGPHTMDDVSHLYEGMYVDVIDDSAYTRHNVAAQIESVDWPNRQITFTSALAAGVDDNDRLYINGSQASSGTAAPVSREPIGLEGSLLETGIYLGIDRGSVSNWKANVLTASAPLDETILMRARVRLTQETGAQLGGMGGFKILTHPTQIDTLFRLAIPRIQYSGASASRPDLGNTGIKFGDLDFVTSHLCPSNAAYLGDWSKSNRLFTPNGQLRIDTEYNGGALKWSTNKDVGVVMLLQYHAFVVRNPRRFVAIRSLTDATR